MFINNFDPVAFQVFSIEIRWYSLAYVIGLVFGWIYCKNKLISDQKLKNLFDDYISYLIIGLIIGGRLGYVLCSPSSVIVKIKVLLCSAGMFLFLSKKLNLFRHLID